MPKENELYDDNALMARELDPIRLHNAYSLLSSNPHQALRQLTELADQGSVMSKLYLAHAYQTGPNANREEAEKWFRAAYKDGASSAIFGLGGLYYREGNYLEAEKIFADGVSKNDGVSMYWLASIYLVDPRHQGKLAEVKELLERSIALGQVHARHGLGLLLLKGRYGIRNVPRGAYLFISGIISAAQVTWRDPTSRRLW